MIEQKIKKITDLVKWETNPPCLPFHRKSMCRIQPKPLSVIMKDFLLASVKGKIAIHTESKIFIQMKQKQMFLLLSWRMIAFMRSFCLHSEAGSGNSSIKRRVKTCSITTMLFAFAIFLSEMRGSVAVLSGI